jgi:transketolase
MLPFVADRAVVARLAGRLHALSDLNRLHALACIVAAQHGWLGASFSAAEIVTALYAGLGERNVVLSKGHAAPIQYAALFAAGLLQADDLLGYKDGPGALQAHADANAPGVLTCTGSLGQALSKTAALASQRPDERFFCLLGDGELQEGQVFEGLQTVSARRLTNLVCVVDRNGFQTERPIDAIKPIPDLAGVATGFGFDVVELDGHDVTALVRALGAPAGERPRFVIARTVKAAGSPLLAAVDDVQPWHGRVPDADLYERLAGELVTRIGDPELLAAFDAHRDAGGATPPRRGAEPGLRSTRDGFAEALPGLLDAHPEAVVLDADLTAPCGLSLVADPEGLHVRSGRFVQMGIAEQDMVSFAGGLALAGRLPIVNSYAAFLLRAIEQVRSNLWEGGRAIYVGHYAGPCYFTDGRTHQCMQDAGIWARLPGVTVLDPATADQAARALRWAAAEAPGPVYLRLRRTPLPLPIEVDDPVRATRVRPGDRRALVVTGSVAARLALDCLELPSFAGWGLVVVPAFGPGAPADALEQALRGLDEVLTMEDDPGLLRETVLDAAARRAQPLRVRSLRPSGPGSSFRTLDACLEHLGLTVAGVLDAASA